MNGESLSKTLHERGNELRMIAGVATASLALMASADSAEAYGTSAGVATQDGEISRTLAFAPSSGRTACTVEEYSPNVYFGTLSIQAQVEEHLHGKWKINPDFRQPNTVNSPDGDPNTVKTQLVFRYNPFALRHLSRENETRIACIGGDSSFMGIHEKHHEITLPVTINHPPKHN